MSANVRGERALSAPPAPGYPVGQHVFVAAPLAPLVVAAPVIAAPVIAPAVPPFPIGAHTILQPYPQYANDSAAHQRMHLLNGPFYPQVITLEIWNLVHNGDTVATYGMPRGQVINGIPCFVCSSLHKTPSRYQAPEPTPFYAFDLNTRANNGTLKKECRYCKRW